MRCLRVEVPAPVEGLPPSGLHQGRSASIIFQEPTLRIGRLNKYVKRSLGKSCPSRGGSVPGPPENSGTTDGGGPREGYGRDRRGSPATTRPPGGRRARGGD